MIKTFGELLPDGVPPRCVLLAVAPPGCGKTTAALQFLKDGYGNGKKAVCITTDVAPLDIMAKMDSFGWKATEAFKGGKLIFVDAYSWRVGVYLHNGVYSVGNLDDLSDLSIKTSEALAKAGNECAVVFDSISTLTMHSSPAAVLKFLEVTFAKFKNAEASAIAIIEKGVHDEQFTTAVRYIVDGIIEAKLDEDKGDLVRYLRVFSMKAVRHLTKWARFNITQNGMVLG